MAVFTLAIIITVIVLRRRKKHSEVKPNAPPDHIYDVPDNTINLRSQPKLQNELREKDIALKVNTTLQTTLSPYDMKSNVAYGLIVSGQQGVQRSIQSDTQTIAVSTV